MKTQCPTCKAKINAPDDYMGRKAKCPNCSRTFICMPFMKHHLPGTSSRSTHTQPSTKTIEKLQRSFDYVCPNKMANIGLAGALEELVQKVSSFGVKCSFQSDTTQPVKDTNISMNLFRIVQEAILNAIKHGKAANITVTLQSTEKLINLVVKDDGIGIADDLSHCDGRGLKIMAYRASLIRGSLQIKRPSDGKGTIIEFNLGLAPMKTSDTTAPLVTDGWGNL